MSTTNLLQFQTEWQKLADKAHKSVGTVMKKVGFDLYRQITQRTPVDTGRARANWQMSVGAPSRAVDLMPELKSRRQEGGGRTAKGGISRTGGYTGSPVPIPPAPSLSEVDGTQPIYIVNNLAYIGPLEHGHSKQAPHGMVALAIESVKGKTEAFMRE